MQKLLIPTWTILTLALITPSLAPADVIHACKRPNGKIRVVDNPDQCRKREDYFSWRTDCPCPSTQVVTLQLSNGWTIFGELSLVSDRGVYFNLVGHHNYDNGGLGHIVGMIRTESGAEWALMSFTYNPLRESRCIPACREPYVMGGWLTYDPVEGWKGEYSMFRGGDFVEAGEWELVGFANE